MFAYVKNVMPDSGNYAYDNSDMRKFVLSTYSHNCGLVDDLGQNRRMNYKWLPEMIAERSDMKWGFTNAVDSVEGAYSKGYGPELTDVTHAREAIFFKNGLSGSLPFALIVDRFTSNDESEHKFATSYQMDTQPYTVNGKVYTADHGDGVTMSIISSILPEVIVAQKEPYYIGWRKRSGADSESFEHSHAPCLQYVAHGKEKRIVTLLYPSNCVKVNVSEVIASDCVDDTLITLVIDGHKVVIDENDYVCSSDASERLI